MNRFKDFDDHSGNFDRILRRLTVELIKAAVLVAAGYAWAMAAFGKGVVH